MNGPEDLQFYINFLVLIVQAISIGFGIGWGIKKGIESIIQKYEELSEDHQEIIDRDNDIIKKIEKIYDSL